MTKAPSILDLSRPAAAGYEAGFRAATDAFAPPKTETSVHLSAEVTDNVGALIQTHVRLLSPNDAEHALRFMQDNPEFKALKTIAERRIYMAKKIRELRREMGEVERDCASKTERLELLKRTHNAFDEMMAWASGPLKLERPSGSMFRALRKAVNSGEAMYMAEEMKKELPILDFEKEVFCEAEILVIEHDWSAALGSATEGATVKLPYDCCAFEFQIDGGAVIALATQFNEDVAFTPIVLTSLGWMVPDYALNLDTDFTGTTPAEKGHGYIQMSALVSRQIRAICIALDAEVATSEIVREPHSGQPGKNHYAPRKPYHVVRLSHRYGRTLPSQSNGTGHRKRLHFRRGHWRHFPTFKTWIKWTLVGNPELGFIEKEYRL